MKSRSAAVAYPGLPLIFAEGFRNYEMRISGHSHASFAVTDAYGTVKTETRAESRKYGVEFTLDGAKPEGSRAAGALEVIREVSSLMTDRMGVRVESINHGILSGSSDSGAAALVTALDGMLELNLPLWRQVELARKVSETAYRSLIGGLSQYVIDDEGNVRVTQLADESFFKDVNIYAVPFDIRRFTADDLHRRVVQHPQYTQRQVQVDYRLRELQYLVDDRNVIGILELMESEAKTVHGMFADMGMDVIKPEMRELIELVADVRTRGLKAFWNAAGGSVVYVFTLHRYAKEVSRELKDSGYRYKHYRVAGPAKTI